MKVCIYGAGAVGGLVAARLASAGVAEVSVVARGAHLAAMRAHGLTLRTAEGEKTVRLAAATDTAAELPAQDLVVVGLKSHQLSGHAEHIAALLAPGANALFMTNGIPWWWHHGLPAGGALPLLDRDGALWSCLRERTLSCIVYAAAEVVAPGIIEHKGLNRWVMGDPVGQESPRLDVVADIFGRGGMEVEISRDIRQDVWIKLSYNGCLGPTCALTRLTVHEVQSNAALRSILAGLVRETWAVAAACGWRVDFDLALLLEPHSRSHGIRPSMLQDVLAGRPMEVDALLGQTQAFARDKGVPTPTIDVVLPLLRGLDGSRGV